MRLNLGCGKMIFPMTDERLAELHPLITVPKTVHEPDWLNVDKFDMPGVDVPLDLFRYPWVGFGDNSVDEIWCSHIVEHIPHETRMSRHLSPIDRDGQKRWRELEELDGWFAFFAECWRILKPDGMLTVLCPWGFSTEAIQDPTHTRAIVPETFHYIAAHSTSQTYDYHVPCKFEVTGEGAVTVAFKPIVNGIPAEQLNGLAYTNNNVARELRVELRAVK